MRTAFLASLLFLSGCAATPDTHMSREMDVHGYDFTRYTEEGLLITPEDYNSSYKSVGMLRVVIWPEMRRERVNGDPYEMTNWKAEPLRMQEAVDSLYTRARQMGADAIIRFDAQRVTQEVDDDTRTGVEASGFAIDRQ